MSGTNLTPSFPDTPVKPVEENPLIGIPYISPNDKQYAAKTQAAVSRAQWEDYKQRFAPYEDKLRDLVDNADNLNQALTQADTYSGEAFDRAKTGLGMTQKKYGTNLDQTTQQASDRRLGLNAAATKAGLRNTVRTAAYDRDTDLMTGAGNAVSGIKQVEEK